MTREGSTGPRLDASEPEDVAEEIGDDIIARAEKGEIIDVDRELGVHPPDVRVRVKEILQDTLLLYRSLGASIPTLTLSVRRIEGYRLGPLLGKGGMAAVYDAVQEQTEHRVALKVVDKIAAGDALVRRFRDEVRRAPLDHPHVVRVYHAGETEDHLFLAMEHLRGPSLAEVLEALRSEEANELVVLRGADAIRAALGWPEAMAIPEPRLRVRRREHVEWCCRVVADVAGALSHAHDAGLVHRDVKPSNILFDEAGIPKLADFGLAKKLDEPSQTASSDSPGTHAYKSPEQVDPREGDVDARSDLFSLGVTLYEILTVRHPFQADGAQAMAKKICARPPAAPERLNPAIPRDLSAVVLKCLEKEPLLRYGTAAELRDDLVSFVQGRKVGAKPVSAITRWGRVLRKDRALRRAVVLVVLLGVLLSGAVAIREQQLEVAAKAQFGQATKYTQYFFERAKSRFAIGDFATGRAHVRSAEALANVAIRLAMTPRDRQTVWAAALQLAMRVNDLGSCATLLDYIDRDQPGDQSEDLLVARAEAVLRCTGDIDSAARFLRSAAAEAREAGEQGSLRRSRLRADILEALGRPQWIQCPGVFDTTAPEVDLGPGRDRLCVGASPDTGLPHLFRWRWGPKGTTTEDLGLLVPDGWKSAADQPRASVEATSVLQRRAADGESLFAAVHLEDRQSLIEVPAAGGSERLEELIDFAWGRPSEPERSERSMSGRMTLLDVDEGGRPRRALLWLRAVKPPAANLAAVEVRYGPAGITHEHIPSTMSHTNGCAVHPGTAWLALGLGEWSGFGVQVLHRQQNRLRPFRLRRMGHISALAPASSIGGTGGFVVCKSNLYKAEQIFGSERPYGWPPGVYACEWAVASHYGWRIVDCDLGFDPDAPGTQFRAVADVRLRTSSGDVSTCFVLVIPQDPQLQTELRIYLSPERSKQGAIAAGWKPILRMRTPECEYGRFQEKLHSSDLDGDGDDEVFIRMFEKTPDAARFGLFVLGLP